MAVHLLPLLGDALCVLKTHDRTDAHQLASQGSQVSMVIPNQVSLVVGIAYRTKKKE